MFIQTKQNIYYLNLNIQNTGEYINPSDYTFSKQYSS